MDVRFGALKPVGFKEHQTFRNKEGKMDAIGFRAYELLNKALDSERLAPVKEAISDKVELRVQRSGDDFQLTTGVAGKDVFSSNVGPAMDEATVANAVDSHVAEAVKLTVQEKLNDAVGQIPSEFRPEAKVSFPGETEEASKPAEKAKPETGSKEPMLPFNLDKYLPTDIGSKVEDTIRGLGKKVGESVPKLPVPGLDSILKGVDTKTLLTLILGAPKKTEKKPEEGPSFPSIPGVPDLGKLKDLIQNVDPSVLKKLLPSMEDVLKDPSKIPGLDKVLPPGMFDDAMDENGKLDPDKLKEKLPPEMQEIFKDGKIDPEKLQEQLPPGLKDLLGGGGGLPNLDKLKDLLGGEGGGLPNLDKLKDLLGGGVPDLDKLKEKLPVDKIPGADEILKDGKVDTDKLLETLKKKFPDADKLPGFSDLTKDPEKLKKAVEEILKKFKK